MHIVFAEAFAHCPLFLTRIFSKPFSSVFIRFYSFGFFNFVYSPFLSYSFLFLDEIWGIYAPTRAELGRVWVPYTVLNPNSSLEHFQTCCRVNPCILQFVNATIEKTYFNFNVNSSCLFVRFMRI